MVLKELIFSTLGVSTFFTVSRGVLIMKELIFHSFYIERLWWS